MILPSRFEELHIVRKIKQTIRKWWRIELLFADSGGALVTSGGTGEAIPALCEAALQSSDATVAGAVQRLIAAGPTQRRALQLEESQLGLQILACPIWDGETFCGALFAWGFVPEGEPADELLEKAARRGIELADREAARAELPVLSARDLVYLEDLLETTVDEIIAFSHAVDAKEKRIVELTTELGGRYQFGNIVGRSPAMQRLFSLLQKVVESDSTVLVTGENGTGKELIARALHYNGPRKAKAFVAQNCSALNDNLLESELFGHVKGSFTGASRDKQGLFKVSDGGTFFLDEVGDMSTAMQVKLLRVLQEGTFLPVGGTKPEKVDVRIITATNRPLKEMVARREFREDLFYRLNVLNIEVPPLRQRLEDLPLLCDHFLKLFAERTKRPLKKLAPEVMARFYEHAWPGNIRELENEIERLAVLSGDRDEIISELLHAGAAPENTIDQSFVRFRERGDLSSAVASLEREMIAQGLTATQGNKTKLAEKLGVSRTTLIKKIKEYGISDRPEPS